MPRSDTSQPQLAQQQKAVKDERTAVNVFLNQFQAGTVAFTTVVVAEIQLLADEETELTYRQDLFLASVSLIEALGGGWDTLLMPTQVQLQKGFSLLQKLEPAPPVVESAPADAVTAVPPTRPPATPPLASPPPAGPPPASPPPGSK